MVWILIIYAFLFAALWSFLAGAAIQNEHWDREVERTVRLLRLYGEAK